MEKSISLMKQESTNHDACRITVSVLENILASASMQKAKAEDWETEFSRYVELKRQEMLIAAYSFTKCWQTAEDVVQSTIINLHSQLFASGDGIRNIGAWVHAAIRNAALNEVRKAKNHQTNPITDASNLSCPSKPCPIEQSEEMEEFMRRVAQLPEQQRTVLHLRLWEHMTYEAIGERIGVSAATAERYFFKSKERLKANS